MGKREGKSYEGFNAENLETTKTKTTRYIVQKFQMENVKIRKSLATRCSIDFADSFWYWIVLRYIEYERRRVKLRMKTFQINFDSRKSLQRRKSLVKWKKERKKSKRKENLRNFLTRWASTGESWRVEKKANSWTIICFDVIFHIWIIYQIIMRVLFIPLEVLRKPNKTFDILAHFLKLFVELL